ncbi:MAG: 3-oxoacid CoA-transferase subunit B [Chloroflexi bacterium]|nr:3-oxoacid CoA-transferase subunit B [Chloroflexota bacterium]
MCDRLAMEFQDDWIVNLGVGMPTLCSNYVDPTKDLIFHSENGVIGYGPLAPAGEEDKHLVNAGGQNVIALPGMAIVHHADSFALIRGGMVDVTVMGAYEVAENGDFANWRIPNRKGGGIGGAMDLAACAKQVFIAMEHTTRDGKPRMLKRCALPITAPGVVTLVATDLGLFKVTPQGFELLENAPGWSPEEIQELTEAELVISSDLKEFRFRD